MTETILQFQQNTANRMWIITELMALIRMHIKGRVEDHFDQPQHVSSDEEQAAFNAGVVFCLNQLDPENAPSYFLDAFDVCKKEEQP